MSSGLIAMVAMVAMMLAAGCSTTPNGAGHPGSKGAKPSRTHGARRAPGLSETADRVSPQELERRAQAHAAFAAGIIHQLDDNSDKSVEMFARSVEQDPAHESLVLDVARRRLLRKEFDAALELLQKASTRPDASLTVFSFLGLTQLQLARTNDAIATYRAAIKRAPAELSSRGLLAQIYVSQHRSDEALAVLDEAGRVGTAEPRYWADLAELYLQLGHRSTNVAERARSAARTSLEKALSLQPNDPALLQRLADRSGDLGDSGVAERLYQQLREKFPQSPIPTAKLADLYLRTGRLPEAAAELERLKKENPANPLPWYFLGVIAAEQKNFTNAVQMFSEATRVNANFEPAWLDLAGAQLNLDRPTDALGTLDSARLTIPPSFRSEFLAAIASGRLGRLDELNRRFSAAEGIARTNQPQILDHLFYFQWGAAGERLGDHANAVEHLQKSLEISPNFAEGLNHLGYLWAERKENLEKAHSMIRRAVELEPENEAYLDSLAWVLFQLKRPAEALPWMEKAIKLAPKSDPTLFDHHGDILTAVGRKGEAQAAWRKSLAVEDDPDVRRKLDVP
ncbi:MAG: tetratricopeptide repeat protein [Pedosphaera sp.]|nr:tetratricopeptide repeat protein [Pedosphaera sp.]